MALASKLGHFIPVENGNFRDTQEQLDRYFEFCAEHAEYEKKDKVVVFYIDAALIFWLFKMGKMQLLQEGIHVMGSFLYLGEDDAEVFEEFRQDLLVEKQNNQDEE